MRKTAEEILAAARSLLKDEERGLLDVDSTGSVDDMNKIFNDMLPDSVIMAESSKDDVDVLSKDITAAFVADSVENAIGDSSASDSLNDVDHLNVVVEDPDSLYKTPSPCVGEDTSFDSKEEREGTRAKVGGGPIDFSGASFRPEEVASKSKVTKDRVHPRPPRHGNSLKQGAATKKGVKTERVRTLSRSKLLILFEDSIFNGRGVAPDPGPALAPDLSVLQPISELLGLDPKRSSSKSK